MTDSIDYSKLAGLPPFAPTGPGRYLLRCGGVAEITKEGDFWDGATGLRWWNTGSYHRYTGVHPLDIILPAPDKLPWEEVAEIKTKIYKLASSHYLADAINHSCEELIEAIECELNALWEENTRSEKILVKAREEGASLHEPIGNAGYKVAVEWRDKYLAIEKEAAHWKANHDHQVKGKQEIQKRKDLIELPLLQRIAELTREVESLRAELAEERRITQAENELREELFADCDNGTGAKEEQAFKVGDIAIYADTKQAFLVEQVNGEHIGTLQNSDFSNKWYVHVDSCVKASPAERLAFFAANPTKLTLEIAQELKICRMCGKGTVDSPFTFNFGKEFAHQKCVNQVQPPMEVVHESLRKRREMEAQCKQAAEIVATWPAWKQGILEQSGEPKVKTSREPVNNFRDEPSKDIEAVAPIITRDGCYKRRDGKVRAIYKYGDTPSKYNYRDEDNNIYCDFGYVAHGGTQMNLIQFLAPLPPAGYHVITVNTGDGLLNNKSVLCFKLGITESWMTCGHVTAVKDFLYAIPIESGPVVIVPAEQPA